MVFTGLLNHFPLLTMAWVTDQVHLVSCLANAVRTMELQNWQPKQNILFWRHAEKTIRQPRSQGPLSSFLSGNEVDSTVLLRLEKSRKVLGFYGEGLQAVLTDFLDWGGEHKNWASERASAILERRALKPLVANIAGLSLSLPRGNLEQTRD